MKKIKNIFYYLFLSISAAVIILIIVLLNPNSSKTITFENKLFLACAFFASCMFGISIAIYPNWWKLNKKNNNRSSDLQGKNNSRSFKGHHPDCTIFTGHVIIINNKVRCAGCLGLLIGALTSILLMILYLVFSFSFSSISYYIFLILGFIMLTFVYLEIIIQKRNAFFHISLNALLILVFFTITISVFEITKEIIYGLLTVLLCFLWLDTRIRISKNQHSRICTYCRQSCKSFRFIF